MCPEAETGHKQWGDEKVLKKVSTHTEYAAHGAKHCCRARAVIASGMSAALYLCIIYKQADAGYAYNLVFYILHNVFITINLETGITT